MKKILFIIFVFCISKSKAQEVVKDTTKYERFKIETGLFVPFGSLDNKIGVSQQFGFWYRTRIQHNDLFDIGFVIIVPKIENSFVYKGKDSVFSVKTKGIESMIGCRVNKLYTINLLRDKATIEWSSSFGLSFFAFEDKESPDDDSGYYHDEDGTLVYRVDTNTKALISPYIGQGIGLVVKKIGIQAIYNFTPYNWFSKRIDSDFGESSLSLLIYYKL